MKREPLVSVASITAAVGAVLTTLVAFGVDLTEDQQKALTGLVAVLAPLAVALWARRKVTPNESVNETLALQRELDRDRGV